MARPPVLGILTVYLNDRKRIDELAMFRKMTIAGKRAGLDVIVFTPDDVEEQTGRIYAHVYQPDKKRWGRLWTRMPHLIYDRARYQRTDRFDRLLAFRRKYADLPFLNRPLRNKWTIYRVLSEVPALHSHLPATRLYESPSDVTALLKRFATVYFKPINGTGGRGILRIERRLGGTYLLQGRNHSRTIVPPRVVRREQLPAMIRAWDRRGDRYLVQQGLQIKLPGGRVHDYRMLVQKNGRGEWEVTGCAGRVGPRNSVTSNLHGGGTAAAMESLLREWVGSEAEISQIRTSAESFGIEVAKTLEATYGTLCELALDLAIDRKGQVWLLEVNQKPAREVFFHAGERDVYRRAITRPIEYALWLHRRQQESPSLYLPEREADKANTAASAAED
ncbi:YheC/YheD family protein [Cohnella sp. CFH 77786]|uniref:YheC/YheD family endospore coat-associated protein n=1 Tax=Cohnella sp. CFH 77786 TaxID=2662265 RepID=UPI001C60F364|nr:YheC/YheD family protein [Cohnella sp. CFH 77786]MBW5447804.1 YheC/YheD family protein [Cohnella sp. CFH 77786]